MWREVIREWHPNLEPIGGCDPGPEFFPGATEEELMDVESQLSIQLPTSLRTLLAETNGVLVIFGTHLIWTTDELMRHNLKMRQNADLQERYMPFDHLLFFADAGVDGILFAFGIIQGEIKREDVYSWNPYDDGRTWKAPSLRKYIEWGFSGKLTVSSPGRDTTAILTRGAAPGANALPGAARAHPRRQRGRASI